MTSLLENPTPILFAGILAEAVLAVFLVQTRRGVLIVAMVGVLLAAIAGVVIERVVVTDGERVEATLDDAVRALSDNDLPGVLACLSSQADRTRQRATWAMGRLRFTSVSIRGLDITINQLTSPPAAEARFTGVAYFRDLRGESPYERYAARFVVELELEGDQWRITDHVENDLSSAWGREE